MESWVTTSNKNPLMNWESMASPSFVTQPVNAGQALGGSGFGDVPRKRVLGDSISDALRGRTDGFLFGEEDSSSKLSGSVVDPGPLIDLKLGRLADQRDGCSFGLLQGAPMLSSSESSTPSKRCRVAGVNSQAAYCQVYGCYKDLSSSKEYHKRHKVCEVHSKTPKVVVSGVEQRFCQQCSRFHLLCEFDDGKRSCRKRLAGHNERRRKPQVGFHSSGRTAKFLLPYNVGKFQVTNDWFNHMKLDSRTKCGPLPLSSFQYWDFQPRMPFCSPSLDKNSFSFQGSNRDSSTTVSVFSNVARYPGLSPLFDKDPSLITEEYGKIFETGSPIQGLSGISEPACARSLLSSQSQNSSSHTSEVPANKSLPQYSNTQVPDNLILKEVSDKFPNPVEASQIGLSAVSDSDSAGFEISDGILRGSGFSDAKDRLPSEEFPTIGLLQLSSQLQRVEHERQYMKLEFDSF